MKKLITLSILIAFTSILVKSQDTISVKETYPTNYSVNTTNGAGYRFWNGNNYFNIALGTGTAYQYGPVTDYSVKMNMNPESDRGWTWGIYGAVPVAALNTEGTLQLKKDLRVLGLLGIGTTSPSYELDVVGDINFTGQLLQNGTPVDLGGGSSLWYAYGSNVYRSSGNVGIGTSSPSKKLHLASYDGGPAPTLRFYHDAAAEYVWDIESSSSLEFKYGTGTNPTTSTKFKFTSDGKLGIGTTSPDAALTVNGNIKAEKIDIILDVPSSDYVFNSDYNLMTIHELGEFIKTNKHLPEVPSADEFKENGYSVGEMDDLLLRKVEELTIYIIELESRLKELEER